MNKRIVPPFVLRSYQLKDIARLKEAFVSHRAVILAAETGIGKTHEAGTLIHDWLHEFLQPQFPHSLDPERPSPLFRRYVQKLRKMHRSE